MSRISSQTWDVTKLLTKTTHYPPISLIKISFPQCPNKIHSTDMAILKNLVTLLSFINGEVRIARALEFHILYWFSHRNQRVREHEKLSSQQTTPTILKLYRGNKDIIEIISELIFIWWRWILSGYQSLVFHEFYSIYWIFLSILRVRWVDLIPWNPDKISRNIYQWLMLNVCKGPAKRSAWVVFLLWFFVSFRVLTTSLPSITESTCNL